jgi:hypothetical protein
MVRTTLPNGRPCNFGRLVSRAVGPHVTANACDLRATWIIILLKVFVTKWVVLHIRP